jgi:hypothetical protein
MAREKHGRLRALLRARQRNKCCYCEREMVKYPPNDKRAWEPEAETLEHLRRREDGGRTTPDNVALACCECNRGRGLVDWFTYKTYRSGELFA